MDDLGVRTVNVLPPSASGEGRLVFQAVGAIVFGTLLIVGLHADDRGDGGSRPADLAPFQMLFRDAVPAVQRMFRELQEGLTEAESTRSASKQWPSVAMLRAEGIPPFALASSGYGWRLFHDGLYVGYLGVPPTGSSGSGAPAFLALIHEPAPDYAASLPPAAPPDETHHWLADGTLLHVTLWFRSDGIIPDGDDALTQPFATGWTQVLVGTQRP